MNKTTRILVGAGTVLAVAVTSFAITRAITAEPEPFPIDDPIAIPEYSYEQADVLAPLAYGELPAGADPMDLDLSDSIGTAQVVVPATEEPSPDTPPPGIVEAAAALDAASGDAASLIPATPDGEEPPGSGGPSTDPASDPCAEPGADPEACPDGVRMELFSLRPGEALTVFATADPVTGPSMGSSIWCTPEEVAGLPEGALALGAITNDPAAVTITYWPADNPSDMRSTSLTQVQTFVEGSARHCGVTEPLAEGDYEGTAFAINADGIISEAWPFTFDSRGRPTTPAMRVLPLGSNWLWVGVYHTIYEAGTIKGFPLVEDGPRDCAAAWDPSITMLRKDIEDHTSVVPASWLEARNYNGAFTRVTSALLYVPEGTSAGICGWTSVTDEPSFDVYEPDRAQFVTVDAPDTYEAVITLRSITTYRPGTVRLTALTHTGGSCGRSSSYNGLFEDPASDTPVTVEVGEELCRIAGQNAQLSVNTTWRNDAGTSEVGRSGARFGLLGASCTGICPEPEPQTYTVFLPGLGQDMCPDRTDDGCDVRRRTAGARAIIDVTWEAGGTGTRDAWGIGSVADEPITEERPDAAEFDGFSSVTTRLDSSGFTATGTAVLRWDRQVDYRVSIVGSCFNETEGAPAPAPSTGTARPDGAGVFRADITLSRLCAGSDYALVATYTDESGVTQTAAPSGIPGVSEDYYWPLGYFITDVRRIEVTAKMEIFRHDRVDASYLVRDSFVDIGGRSLNPSFGPWLHERCFDVARVGSDPGIGTVVQQRTYTVEPLLNIFTDWFYYPTSPTCEWRANDRWVIPSSGTVTLAQLLDGAEMSGPLVRRDFPDEEEPYDPFTYRLTLRGEYVDE
jgi:hypothetical protein